MLRGGESHARYPNRPSTSLSFRCEPGFEYATDEEGLTQPATSWIEFGVDVLVALCQITTSESLSVIILDATTKP